MRHSGRMTTRIRSILATFGWWQWLLAGVFLLALVMVALFAVRAARYSAYWRTHHQEPIERWMTVDYVAHSYEVPSEVLWGALGLPDPRAEHRRDRRPLSEIAEATGRSFDDLHETLRAAIERARPPDPPPAIGPAPPGADSERGGP